MNEAMRKKFDEFCEKHGLVFAEDGEVGFGRRATGFLKNNSYIYFNPYAYGTMEQVWEDYVTPDTVPDAYHKTDCMAVLVSNDNIDEAHRQLALWVDDIEEKGGRVVEFPTGYDFRNQVGLMLHGAYGYAFKFTD